MKGIVIENEGRTKRLWTGRGGVRKIQKTNGLEACIGSKMNTVPLWQLESMFSQMREAGWNVDEPLLWGYFFFDPDQSKLERFAIYAEKMQYCVVRIFKADNGVTYVLHIEKVETHTPVSLNKRNIEFEQLAQEFGLESYDGMDVGRTTA